MLVFSPPLAPDADTEQIAGTACERCAPRPPKIHWIKKAGKKNKNGNNTKSSIVAFEDKLEAGRYEHVSRAYIDCRLSVDCLSGSEEPPGAICRAAPPRE